MIALLVRTSLCFMQVDWHTTVRALCYLFCCKRSTLLHIFVPFEIFFRRSFTIHVDQWHHAKSNFLRYFAQTSKHGRHLCSVTMHTQISKSTSASVFIDVSSSSIETIRIPGIINFVCSIAPHEPSGNFVNPCTTAKLLHSPSKRTPNGPGGTSTTLVSKFSIVIDNLL